MSKPPILSRLARDLKRRGRLLDLECSADAPDRHVIAQLARRIQVDAECVLELAAGARDEDDDLADALEQNGGTIAATDPNRGH